MSASSLARAAFIDQVLTSTLPDQVAKRFAFADGEVGALYTMGVDTRSGKPHPVVLFVATFPPSTQQDGLHDFGIDYLQRLVASAAEASELLAQFGPEEAAQFRASCRTQ